MKKATRLMLILTAFLFTVNQQAVIAQEKNETKKEFKNTIHFNVTNPIIFGGRSLIFGYERVLNKKRSFSVNFGQTGFPSLNILNADSIRANAVTDEKGFNISADYRFYLGKENKHAIPHGVYIGPYYSYNYFEKKHSWAIKSTAGGAAQTVESKTSLGIHTVGFEMGYQFIFWDRVSLDLVLSGPGIATYKLEASIGANLSEEDKKKFFEKLNQALAEKFPGYSWVIDEGEFQKTGSANSTRFGYRYMIQVGFRF